jgi:DtxR family Mn-dependent transcriptional regulator
MLGKKGNSGISLKQQRYVETIFELSKIHGHAHSKDIAETLGIKMASVTDAIKKLAEMGLVNYQARKSITLTDRGLEIALALDEKHLVLADFFNNILGCSPKRSESFACSVEHVIDEEFSDRLADFALFLKKESSGKNLISEFHKKYNKASDTDDSK